MNKDELKSIVMDTAKIESHSLFIPEIKDYVIYKEYMHRSGMPKEVKDSREFVQVISGVAEDQMIYLCRRLNATCKHSGMNLHYGFTELEPYKDEFENA